ncbi:MAG: GNAT family N-acetyltransferase [Pseudomonadota bacterium]
MQKLAEFEGYDNDFRVTEESIEEHGFGDEALFHAFVAECPKSNELVGMAISYVLPWTYDLKPTLVLKELYVEKCFRGIGIGPMLMSSIAQRAIDLRAERIQWTVLSGNSKAIAFYSKLNGHQDHVWEPWLMEREQIERLASAAISNNKIV